MTDEQREIISGLELFDHGLTDLFILFLSTVTIRLN